MARKKEIISPDESGQERFRRVINKRIKPLIQRYEQITNMATQPQYEASENDVKLVIAEVNKVHEKFISQFQRLLDGTLKAKETKEYSGIDWDKEIIDEGD